MGQMTRDHLTWGRCRLVNAWRLARGLRVSPRTVRKYMSSGCHRDPGQRAQGQRWHPCMCNDTEGLIRSDLSTVLSWGWHVFSMGVISCLQRWRGRFAAEELRSTTWSQASSMFFRCPTRSLGLEDVAYPADGPRVGERSPPALRPSHIRYRMSAATAVRMFDVRLSELAPHKGKLARTALMGILDWLKQVFQFMNPLHKGHWNLIRQEFLSRPDMARDSGGHGWCHWLPALLRALPPGGFRRFQRLP
jgi:hypothetical protein